VKNFFNRVVTVDAEGFEFFSDFIQSIFQESPALIFKTFSVFLIYSKERLLSLIFYD